MLVITECPIKGVFPFCDFFFVIVTPIYIGGTLVCRFNKLNLPNPCHEEVFSPLSICVSQLGPNHSVIILTPVWKYQQSQAKCEIKSLNSCSVSELKKENRKKIN